jgi:hypothetical protein
MNMFNRGAMAERLLMTTTLKPELGNASVGKINIFFSFFGIQKTFFYFLIEEMIGIEKK